MMFTMKHARLLYEYWLKSFAPIGSSHPTFDKLPSDDQRRWLGMADMIQKAQTTDIIDEMITKFIEIKEELNDV